MDEVRDLRIQQQEYLRSEFVRLKEQGVTRFDFMGGRRSGKTYFILQRLLGRMAQGKVVSVATMTDTQGRLGAFQDTIDILSESPSLAPYVRVIRNTREIQCAGGGRMFFKSYQTSERAKGIACDDLYINEANNFTEQQYIDLAMSVRGNIFADRNPNTECWTERNGFSLIHSTWLNNREHLTEAQIAEFEKLKAKAESPDATSADIAFYRMYYLGEYAEIEGAIFTPTNLQREQVVKTGMQGYFIYGDPSAMCGADYFALVLAGWRNGLLYILDVWSQNVGTRADVADQIAEWCEQYDVREIFIEGNGLTGKTFLEEQRSSFPNLRPYMNKDNKHGRILGNYEGICSRVVFNEGAKGMSEFLKQVYQYEGKERANIHDDNIDAVNSAYEIAKRRFRAF